MKRLILLVLMLAWMLPLSHVTYGYGDALFHALVKRGMEDAPKVAPPTTTEMPCTGSASAGLSRHHTAEELEEDLRTRDTVCGHSHMGFGVSSVNDLQCQRGGKLDEDCVRHNQAANVRVPELELTLQNCTMWYPPTASITGAGIGVWTATAAEIPAGYVRYKGGYTHKDCVPR